MYQEERKCIKEQLGEEEAKEGIKSVDELKRKRGRKRGEMNRKRIKENQSINDR